MKLLAILLAALLTVSSVNAHDMQHFPLVLTTAAETQLDAIAGALVTAEELVPDAEFVSVKITPIKDESGKITGYEATLVLSLNEQQVKELKDKITPKA